MISVVICTFNPSLDYLQRVLDSLRMQSIASENWELIIIDNNSTNNTLQNVELSWHVNAKIIVEPTPGVANARMRSIKEASGEIILFVDDDNVLDNEYIEKMVKIGNQYPQLGVWGAGTISPEFEIDPPEHYRSHTVLLALRNAAYDKMGNNPRDKGMAPYGAGMAFRRKVGEAVIREFQSNEALVILAKLCRNQNGLFSGEDIQFSYEAVKMGMMIGNFVQLKITHLIPKRRIDFNYLLALRRSHMASDMLLQYANQNKCGWALRRKVRFFMEFVKSDFVGQQFMIEDLAGLYAGLDMIRRIQNEQVTGTSKV